MGVPAFFRWLTMRCPKILQDAVENEIIDEEEDFGEYQQQNPEVDNLYLDMNGIIHPCVHPENGGVPVPLTEIDMFNNIFAYIDRIMNLVRPRKILFMAIDGVAPRAKLNQQRSRRFRAALESKQNQEKKIALSKQWKDKGICNQDQLQKFLESKFDHNVITPGTDFMARLTIAVQNYVIVRQNTDPLWRDIAVILSDWSVPGEGEHKLLDFIRAQRAQKKYNPNTRHCIYGADADLIMLGLSTHEIYFYILRETVMRPDEKKCTMCGQSGHLFTECEGEARQKQGDFDEKEKKQIRVNFQYIKLPVLREFVNLEFQELQLPFQYNLERIIDDFVFMCFLVGNDFLPHLPCLDIRQGGIDCLLQLYKYILPHIQGYITENGSIDLLRLDVFLNHLAKFEETLLLDIAKDKEFQNKREQSKIYFREKQKQREQQEKEQEQQYLKQQKEHQDQKQEQMSQNEKNKQAALRMKEQLQQSIQEESQKEEKTKLNKTQQDEQQGDNTKYKQKKDHQNEENLEEIFKQELKNMIDEEREQIRNAHTMSELQEGPDYYSHGYKQRYYQEKFQVYPKDFLEFRQKIQQSYIEGLCWNYAYYYKGCISWKWYYPYHYAPYASDLEGLGELKINFEIGQPFRPVDQLLAVLSPLSSHAIPPCFRHYMLKDTSEIIDFYPAEFKIDTKGKRQAWMGEVILPFIDESRLLEAIKKCENQMTQVERERNKIGNNELFLNVNGSFSKFISQNKQQQQQSDNSQSLELTTYELSGKLVSTNNLKMGSHLSIAFGNLNLQEIDDNQVQKYLFFHPHFEEHSTQLLENVVLPVQELDTFIMSQVERRGYCGEKVTRMVEHALNQNKFLTRYQNPSNELINQGHFNRNYQHNHFTHSYNNNRSVYREAYEYKSQATLEKMKAKEDERNQKNFDRIQTQMNSRTHNQFNIFEYQVTQQNSDNQYTENTQDESSQTQQYQKQSYSQNKQYGQYAKEQRSYQQSHYQQRYQQGQESYQNRQQEQGGYYKKEYKSSSHSHKGQSPQNEQQQYKKGGQQYYQNGGGQKQYNQQNYQQQYSRQKSQNFTHQDQYQSQQNYIYGQQVNQGYQNLLYQGNQQETHWSDQKQNQQYKSNQQQYGLQQQQFNNPYQQYEYEINKQEEDNGNVHMNEKRKNDQGEKSQSDLLLDVKIKKRKF